MRTTMIVEEGKYDKEKVQQSLENVRTMWYLEHLVEKYINYLEQPSISLLTKFHASDVTDKAK
jgi:hypothetical protein